MKKFLIVNDDGIGSDGIVRLASAAAKIGEVYVVAPESQRSACSHSITLRRPLTVRRVSFPVPGVEAFSCDGQPADCVRIGVRNIVPGGPDHVLSGINYGYNISSDIQYSATAGAAFEAAFQKVHSIAFSEDATDIHEISDHYLEGILEDLLGRALDKGQIWNVNFPGCRLSECKGILYDRKVYSGDFYDDTYDEEGNPDGSCRYTVQGRRNLTADEGTDLRAILDNYISIGTVTNIS